MLVDKFNDARRFVAETEENVEFWHTLNMKVTKIKNIGHYLMLNLVTGTPIITLISVHHPFFGNKYELPTHARRFLPDKLTVKEKPLYVTSVISALTMEICG
jgi:hypothetical protein